MSTHAEITTAILNRGYRDVGTHKCTEPGCDNLLDHIAIKLGFPGCMCECRACIEKSNGRTIEESLARVKPRQYPTTGTISCDDPSIYGSEVLGHEGESWESFARRHQPRVDSTCAEPYRRGIGQGFGSTEDGEAE